MNYLHAARKAFIESESSEQIQKARRKNIQPSGVSFENVDKVYYQRSSSLRKVDHSSGMLKETIVHQDERECVVPECKSYDITQDTDEKDNASVDSAILAETVKIIIIISNQTHQNLMLKREIWKGLVN